MASYLELYTMFDNDDLRRKIEVALLIKAQEYLDGSATQQQRAWAKMIFSDGHGESIRMLKYLLGKNKDSSLNQIATVTDANLKTQVDAVAPQFVSAFTGA